MVCARNIAFLEAAHVQVSVKYNMMFIALQALYGNREDPLISRWKSLPVLL